MGKRELRMSNLISSARASYNVSINTLGHITLVAFLLIASEDETNSPER